MIFRMEVKASANEKIETLPSDCVYDARRLALCATENVRKIDIICKNIQVTHVVAHNRNFSVYAQLWSIL